MLIYNLLLILSFQIRKSFLTLLKRRGLEKVSFFFVKVNSKGRLTSRLVSRLVGKFASKLVSRLVSKLTGVILLVKLYIREARLFYKA